MSDPPRAAEFDLIELIRRRVATREDVVLGIGDDAAIVQVPVGKQLVIAADTLNRGIHFPDNTAPADIGWKALAVNLSDLAAMGAEPAWCTLSLSLPTGDPDWVGAFLDGFLALAAQHRVALIGGDTTRGPLSVSVAVHGFIAPGRALRRGGAQVGDDVWVTGTLGEATGALTQWRAGAIVDPVLRARLDRPTPRVAVGARIVDVAHACIDVSDGLLADLRHVCDASGVAAEVALEGLPALPELLAAFETQRRQAIQATGGDDYELCFTAPAEAREAIDRIAAESATPITRVGRIVAGQGVRALRADGSEWIAPSAGFVHFA
ncbi:thiamine-phosphate kinase [Lysobacter solisilvae (ex Woo and Kim 2020)]|uniref:Thiamine-monophosphate kinase n=1 Tax=Agrilutibacter terrestris TaxID=2865112 RepID=A0A7H0FZ97_9GAMM|nr:thiamine-phosphate kinase [Lysobacter terrestris]QNP41363.1 thiamine-phosphate kinase [Lysobacter terrestris]